MVYLKENITFQGSKRGPTFSKGAGFKTTFQGAHLLISVKTYRTCDFPEWGS